MVILRYLSAHRCWIPLASNCLVSLKSSRKLSVPPQWHIFQRTVNFLWMKERGPAPLESRRHSLECPIDSQVALLRAGHWCVCVCACTWPFHDSLCWRTGTETGINALWASAIFHNWIPRFCDEKMVCLLCFDGPWSTEHSVLVADCSPRWFLPVGVCRSSASLLGDFMWGEEGEVEMQAKHSLAL